MRHKNSSLPKRSSPFYLGLIPARGGSKRIPRKNLVPLSGKPLISFTIRAALESKRLSKVLVSTEDQEIADYSRSLGAEVPFLRPAEFARDQSPGSEAILHAFSRLEKEGARVDAVVLLQPTSPLRTSSHIDQCIKLFEATRADTLTTVCEAKHHPFHAWNLKKNGRLTPFYPLRYQFLAKNQLPHAVIENGAVYIFSRSMLRRKKLYGKNIVPFFMDSRVSIDIDTFDDLKRAEYALQTA